MPLSIPKPDQYQEMREALRDLCSRYDSAYWQKKLIMNVVTPKRL